MSECRADFVLVAIDWDSKYLLLAAVAAEGDGMAVAVDDESRTVAAFVDSKTDFEARAGAAVDSERDVVVVAVAVAAVLGVVATVATIQVVRGVKRIEAYVTRDPNPCRSWG